MARRSLGPVAAAGNQLVTLAEVQALIAAAGGGGSTTAVTNRRPTFPTPAVGEWLRLRATAIETARRPLNDLRLGWEWLPGGTYDQAFVALANPGTSASMVKAVAYADSTSNPGRPAGAPLLDTAKKTGNVSNGITFDGFSLVIPAGGMGLWVGTVTQDAASSADGPNLYVSSRTSDPTVWPSTPTINFTNVHSGWSVTGLSGAAPTDPTMVRAFEGHSLLSFRRSA